MSGDEARLLIVDDDDLVRGMLQAVLEDAGYACVTAGSVAEAEHALSAGQVEIALVDVMLPDGSGIDVVATLHDRFPGTATLVVTGLPDQATARQAIARGAHGMLVKPFTPDELIVAVAAASTRRDLDVEARTPTDAPAGEPRSATGRLESALTRIDSAGHELLTRLAGALEARDLLTSEHIRRVSEGTRLLARALGLPSGEAELIGEASTMHDVGKIGLSDDILRKPGPLSEAEWEAVREHPVIGRRILENSDLPVMRVAALIAAHHHERWDGTGYPDGLAGKQIPLAARIVAVVDTFDALTSARPYRGPLPVDEALGILREGAGTHFDPAVVLYASDGDRCLLLDGLDPGIRAFVRKEAPAGDLIHAVTLASDGGLYVDPLLVAVLAGTEAAARLPMFTPRERDILRLLAGGLRTAQIGEHLSIAADTVRMYLRNVLKKLDADPRTHAVALALRQSLAQPGTPPGLAPTA